MSKIELIVQNTRNSPEIYLPSSLLLPNNSDTETLYAPNFSNKKSPP